jgi:tetratricopeptide (TPR) repeat protein
MTKFRNNVLFLMLFICIFFCLEAFAQENSKQKVMPNATSEEEYKDSRLFTEAVETEKQLALAQRFLIKYPKSNIRPLAYRYVVTASIKLKDFTQAIAGAERALEEDPENITILSEICRMGSEQAYSNDFTFILRAEEMGRRAIRLIEQGNIPYEYSPEQWQTNRSAFLSSLYKSIGTLAYFQECWSDSYQQFQSATKLFPNDPYNYLMMAKSELMDLIIGVRSDSQEHILNNYSRAYVLSERDEYKWMHSTVGSELKLIVDRLKAPKSIEEYIDIARDEINTSTIYAKP